MRRARGLADTRSGSCWSRQAPDARAGVLDADSPSILRFKARAAGRSETPQLRDPETQTTYSDSRPPASDPRIGNLNPMYVPELMPISASIVALNSGIVRSQNTAVRKIPPRTSVQTTT